MLIISKAKTFSECRPADSERDAYILSSEHHERGGVQLMVVKKKTVRNQKTLSKGNFVDEVNEEESMKK